MDIFGENTFMTFLEVKEIITCPHKEWKVMGGDEVLPPWEVLNPDYDQYQKEHQCEAVIVLQEFRRLKYYFIKGEPEREEVVMQI